MMPKRKNTQTHKEQSARFRAEVESLIAAGGLNPTEAGAALERAMRGVRKKGDSPSGE